MYMELRPLDITVISADGIKNVNTFSKMDVYVELSLSSNPTSTTTIKRMTTYVDRNGGTNPKWNHPMSFTLNNASITNPGGLFLIFHLKSKRTLWDKEIGQVSIPMHELFSQSFNNNISTGNITEYPVFIKNGKPPKGTLKISFKLGEKFTHAMEPHMKFDLSMNEPVIAYPAPAYPSLQQPRYAYGGYPPLGLAGYLPVAAPAGYRYTPHFGYGYPPVQQPKRKNKSGGLGLGLGAGLLGGMLAVDMIS